MSEVKVNKISPRSGTTVTLGDSGDTFTLASGVSLTGVNATFSGDLTVDTDTLYVDSTNNRVGIGTSSPLGKLHIKDSSAVNTQIAIENTSAATSTDYRIVAGKVGVSNEGFSIYDSANTTTAYYIDSSGNHEFLGGNVGIGTSSPSQALDVVGSIEVSDSIYLGGTGSANALDDYEEGTWTPSIGGTATYSNQEGVYQKVGNTVFVRFAITVTTRGTGSQAVISGLPFSMGSNEYPFFVGYFSNLQNNVVEFQMRGFQSSVYATWLLSAGNTVTVNPSYIQNGTSILASGVYKV